MCWYFGPMGIAIRFIHREEQSKSEGLRYRGVRGDGSGRCRVEEINEMRCFESDVVTMRCLDMSAALSRFGQEKVSDTTNKGSDFARPIEQSNEGKN